MRRLEDEVFGKAATPLDDKPGVPMGTKRMAPAVPQVELNGLRRK
ncbi:MAG: hypothetical protein QM682_13360 [Paracoccus sp. (in: a-proteobacteria)]